MTLPSFEEHEKTSDYGGSNNSDSSIISDKKDQNETLDVDKSYALGISIHTGTDGELIKKYKVSD